MYPTDPRQLNTERQIYLDKQFFVDVFSIPACVRNTNGDFIGYNEKFSKEGANKQVISSQADSLIKISRIWADFFPANTSNQPI
ncbi:restriction endonuclease [Escherichia coli]